MKKFYSTVLGLLAIGVANAQCVSTFDTYSLPSESYWDGSDQSGGFAGDDCGDAFLSNYYDGTYMYWASGFAYSNVTNNTTSGNSFGAYPGDDYNGGGNFVLGQAAFSNANIDLQGESSNVSFYVTNSSYSAISMLNGDQFAKVFGESVNANGDPDGTNGEDFFFLRCYAINAIAEKLDSVDAYLADYRFTDNSMDYILDTWTQVSFTQTNISQIEFKLFSSDDSGFGMNTPGHFALDNLSYTKLSTSVNDISNSVNVYPNPSNETINIDGVSGQLTLIDLKGSVMLNKTISKFDALDISSLAKGIYTMKIVSENGIAIKQVIRN